MNAAEKIMLVVSMLLGGAAGQAAFGSTLGIVFGVLAGMAVLALSLWIGDEVDTRLRKHYRSI